LRRVQESEELWSKLDKLREKHRLPERTISALFDTAIGLRIRNSSYRSTLRANEEEISNQLATGDLRAMVEAGLLRQLGAKRGTYYQAAEPLQEIAAGVRSNRKVLDASSLFAA
jgi:predicted HTH transcriptional regulator